jgi:hypothetical protein
LNADADEVDSQIAMHAQAVASATLLARGHVVALLA